MHAQYLDITLHITHDYSLLIQNIRVNSPFKVTGNRNVQQEKGGTALPAALGGHTSDGGRRVSQRACCYHAMTVDHDEL